jgi:hydrogenase nickel incorporation protein HypA/HybF
MQESRKKMHELAITRSLVAGVAERIGEVRVTRVVVHIGRLSGVVPHALEQCFEICAQGTVLDGARLDIVEVPGRARCRECGAEVEVDDPIPFCPCGGVDLEILQGRELRVKEVEVI